MQFPIYGDDSSFPVIACVEPYYNPADSGKDWIDTKFGRIQLITESYETPRWRDYV